MQIDRAEDALSDGMRGFHRFFVPALHEALKEKFRPNVSKRSLSAVTNNVRFDSRWFLLKAHTKAFANRGGKSLIDASCETPWIIYLALSCKSPDQQRMFERLAPLFLPLCLSLSLSSSLFLSPSMCTSVRLLRRLSLTRLLL